MMVCLKDYLGAALVFALCACQPPPRVADAPPRQYPFDQPPSLAADEILPGGRDVCRKLGLDPEIPGRCNSVAVLAASRRQTERSLWFSKTTTGPASDACPDPIDFSRANGRQQTLTILCGQPKADPVITQAELDKLRARAEQLNTLPHKTLAQHTAAVELKHEIACHVGTTADDCD